jgi:hypothetical protein
MDTAAELSRLHDGLRRIGGLLADEVRLARETPEVSGWSVARQLHHTLLVAGSIATAVRTLTRGRGEEGTKTSAQARELLEGGSLPRGVAKAPAAFEPDEDPDPAMLRALLTKTRSRWEALTGQEGEIDGAAGRLPHPLLGPLAATEWVRFAAVHTEHHLWTVAEILGS